MAFSFEEFPNSDFYNSDLREILTCIRKIVDELKILDEWKETHESEYQKLKDITDDIKSQLDDIVNGNLPESMYSAMESWWRTNAVDLVGELVHFVFFGLTLDGYFVAYIPENWRGISFDTIINPGDNYGKLCIIY